MCKNKTSKLCVVISEISQNLQNAMPDGEAPKPFPQDNSNAIDPVTGVETNEIGQ